MRTFRADPASEADHELAEGPVWDAARRTLLWVDIEDATVHEGVLRGGRIERVARHRFEGTVGAAVRAEDGRLLVAAHRELLVLGADGAELDRLRVVPGELASRWNDGGCDPAGRFVVGTMAMDERTGREELLRLDGDGALTVIDDDLTQSNGLAWSPDGGTFYSIDTATRTVFERAYDVGDGVAGARAPLLRVDGTPDGMCTDADGHLWVAIFDAGEVRRYTPEGRHVATVEVGVPNPTSVAFVGADLATLLITTARHELSAQQRASHPASGALFLADVGVRGNPVALWDGAWRTRS